MEENIILCPRCGQRLAQLLGETPPERRLRALGAARVRTARNALGERMAWLQCPQCKAEKEINPAHWIGGAEPADSAEGAAAPD